MHISRKYEKKRKKNTKAKMKKKNKQTSKQTVTYKSSLKCSLEVNIREIGRRNVAGGYSLIFVNEENLKKKRKIFLGRTFVCSFVHSLSLVRFGNKKKYGEYERKPWNHLHARVRDD